MRALLLAGVTVLAFGSMPAAAQLAVICPTCSSEFSSLANAAKQAGDMLSQLRQLQQNYAMLSRTYSSLSGARNVADIAASLGSVTRAYLPEASSTLAMVGQGAAMLNGRAGSFRQADQLFIPQALAGSRSMERWLSEMERRENSTASTKALAEASIADMQDRVAQLGAAEARISGSHDVAETAAVAALISTSQANLAAHHAQISAMQLALAAENRTELTRGEQAQAEAADSWARNSRWAMDALAAGVE